jgi:hypothetical protein
MGNFLKSLVESSRVPLYVDFRTGSARSLSGLAANVEPTVTNTPRFQRTEGGLGVNFRNGYLTYAHQADQTLTQGTWVFLLDLSAPIQAFERLMYKRSATTAYDFYIYNTGGNLGIGYYTGATNQVSVGSPGRRTKTFIWSHANGGIPAYFLDGVRMASPFVAASIGTGTPDIVLGNTTTGVQPLYRPLRAAIIINEALSDADIARLHGELVEGPTVVSRPRTHFSLPYPAKTPSEYVAEGMVLDMEPVMTAGKKVPNHAGTAGVVMETGIDTVRGGPFRSGLAFRGSGYISGIIAAASPTEATFSFWLRLTGAGTEVLHAGNTLIRIGTAVNFFADLTKAARSVNISIRRKWTRIDISVVGDSSLLFVDGVNVPWNAGTSYPLALGVNPTYQIGRYGGGGTRLNADVELAQIRTVALTSVEIRAEYLAGARECLLDARIHSDGSCPVNLTALGAGNEVTNGWKVRSGTWKVVEDAPVDGRPGKRWLDCIASGLVYCQDHSASFGSWLIEYEHTGSSFINFLSDRVGATNEPIGYALVATAGFLYFRRNLGSSHVNPWATSSDFLTVGVRYKFWITRRPDGTFTVWIRGGVYTDWTLVPTASGTNPYIDANYVQPLPYACFDIDLPSMVGGFQHFLGEMTPAEAIQAGILE